MGYENDPMMDEDGEPLMDLDEQSDREASPQPRFVVDDDDDLDEDDWRRSRSPTPILEDKTGKPRKRLVKKSGKEATPSPVRSESPGNELNDWVEDQEEEEEEEEEAGSSKKRKGYDLLKVGTGKGESFGKKEKKEKKRKKEKGSSSRDVERGGKGWTPSGSGSGSKGYGGGRGKDQGADPEMKELWDTIAGNDSEDDQEGVRTLDDDNFIDDAGVDPIDRFGSDNEGSAGNAPQAEEGEEDEEINKLFKGGKKKKKNEKSPEELANNVENCIAEFEVIAEEDAELNRQSKPAINKLRKLPMLIDVLSKKSLQITFLDHGILNILKIWLEPLPDGSLPNMNIRTAILNILSDFPIDLQEDQRRTQLKKSGLGKVIMFLSKSDEETTANRKLAKELVDKWSRPIFNKSTRFEDMRNYDDERIPYRRTPVKKPANKSRGLESRDDDLDEFLQGPKSGQGASRQHASRPEATPLDFVVRPQSKIDPDEIRARAKQQVQDPRRLKMNKKLQQLKAPKKKQLQASKLSVEGRGMVKYL